MAKQKFKIGDWVRIHKAGIWQVFRTLRVKCLDPVTQSKVERDILFVKRFVTNSFRKSFGQECCAPTLAKPLSINDRKKLDSLIAENPGWLAQFDSHELDPVNNLYNARAAVLTGKTSKDVSTLLVTDQKFTEFDIKPYLQSKGLSDGFPYWTIQFVSLDHETSEDGHLLYSFERVLEF